MTADMQAEIERLQARVEELDEEASTWSNKAAELYARDLRRELLLWDAADVLEVKGCTLFAAAIRAELGEKP